MAEYLEDVRIQLPGFGLPLEQASLMANAMNGWDANPIMVRERCMIALMATIKDKPEWTRKVFDERIVATWQAEALEFGKELVAKSRSEEENDDSEDPDRPRENGENIDFNGSRRQKTVSERMFDYCIAELRGAATSIAENCATPAIDANAIVYMSDSAVSHATKAKLKSGVSNLEDVPEAKEDWHPGSDSKVLDLVHPSLCPLVYGKTRILTEGHVPLADCHKHVGKGETVPKPEGSTMYYSENFQWLPCEVKLNEKGHAEIHSYIDNLHPAGNEDLYSAIEDVITQAIPLWTDSLASTLILPNRDRMEDVGDGYVKKETESDGEEEEEEEMVDDDSESETDYVPPEPIKYGGGWRAHPEDGSSSMQDKSRELERLINETGMQVIVKLANIHLTPEKPTYDGGSWHIEGQMNEHICASALYYYDEENITPSYLAFREHVEPDILMGRAEQHREWGLCAVYGIEDNWGDAQQVLGKIRTREDRLLAFLNVLQHRVSPFQLIDVTKPGHRKILALFLVDPYIKIPSTANVPPQQAEWWIRDGQMDHVFGHFPNEIADQIIDELDFPFSMETAKEIRDDLIKERKVFVQQIDDHFLEQSYCFCEH